MAYTEMNMSKFELFRVEIISKRHLEYRVKIRNFQKKINHRNKTNSFQFPWECSVHKYLLNCEIHF